MSEYSALRINRFFPPFFPSHGTVSVRGRCHVWPCRTEFSGVAKSCLLHSALTIFSGCIFWLTSKWQKLNLKQISILHLIFHRITVVWVLFFSLKKGLTPENSGVVVYRNKYHFIIFSICPALKTWGLVQHVFQGNSSFSVMDQETCECTPYLNVVAWVTETKRWDYIEDIYIYLNLNTRRLVLGSPDLSFSFLVLYVHGGETAY